GILFGWLYFARWSGRIDAAADLRAGPNGGRSGHPGTRLRLGFSHAVDGGAISERQDHWSIEFYVATGVHRGTGGPTWTRQRAHRYLGHEFLCRCRTLRPRGVRGNVRAHAQLGGLTRARRSVAKAGRKTFHSHLHA